MTVELGSDLGMDSMDHQELRLDKIFEPQHGGPWARSCQLHCAAVSAVASAAASAAAMAASIEVSASAASSAAFSAT